MRDTLAAPNESINSSRTAECHSECGCWAAFSGQTHSGGELTLSEHKRTAVFVPGGSAFLSWPGTSPSLHLVGLSCRAPWVGWAWGSGFRVQGLCFLWQSVSTTFSLKISIDSYCKTLPLCEKYKQQSEAKGSLANYISSFWEWMSISVTHICC